MLGAVFLKLSGINKHGEQLTTSAVVYVTDSTSLFYLSRAAQEQLGVSGPDFPKIGATGEAEEFSQHQCRPQSHFGRLRMPTWHRTTTPTSQVAHGTVT